MKSRITLAILVFFLVVFACLFTGAAARAEIKSSPFQLALANPAQLINEDASIYGLRLNILYGKNRNVYGFDFGIFNYTIHDTGGLQFSPFINLTEGKMYGIQAGLTNYADKGGWGIQVGGVNAIGNGEFIGPQVGALFNYAEAGMVYGSISPFFNLAGYCHGPMVASMINVTRGDATVLMASGLFNWAQKDAAAIMVSTFNMVNNKFYGGMIGGFNITGSSSGIMAGALNVCDAGSGISIGIFNFAKKYSGIQIGLINIITNGAIPFLPGINISMSNSESSAPQYRQQQYRQPRQQRRYR